MMTDWTRVEITVSDQLVCMFWREKQQNLMVNLMQLMKGKEKPYMTQVLDLSK